MWDKKGGKVVADGRRKEKSEAREVSWEIMRQ